MTRKRTRRHSRAPWLCRLEDRLVPAMFFVDDLASNDEYDGGRLINGQPAGSFKWAIRMANETPNDSQPDMICIIQMGTISPDESINVTEAVVIDPYGASQVKIDGGQLPAGVPLFNIDCRAIDAAAPVTFLGLTIQNAKSRAITVTNGSVVIDKCVLANNSTGGSGGAIFLAAGPTFQSIQIIDSTITGNTAGGAGGAVFAQGPVQVTVTNSTIANNTAGGNGGAFAVPGFVAQNSTITGNSAAGGGGGVFLNVTNTVELDSSIVSGNFANGLGPDINAQALYFIYSAVGSADGIISSTGSNNLPFNTALNLQPLGDNGGETKTIALGPGSPAIDAGANAGMLQFDQRGVGFPRSLGTAADIGAFESGVGNTPRAVTLLTDVNSAGGGVYTFDVTYSDDVAIDVSTLGANDLTVTGPNGFTTLATFVTVSNMTNGTPRVATYDFVPPGGSWDAADRGEYSVFVNSGQVFDTAINSVPAGRIGSFHVRIDNTLVVSNADDFGPGSLRGALDTINAGKGQFDHATITFSNAFFAVPRIITLSGPLVVSAPVMIDGPGTTLLTLSGGSFSRIFDVNVSNPSGYLTLRDLKIANGSSASDGGAIRLQDENLQLFNVAITDSSTQGNGGAIASQGGSVFVVNSSIQGNSSLLAGGGLSMLGGDLLIAGSTIAGNSAGTDGGGWRFESSDAVIHSIINSTLSSNFASQGGAANLNSFLGKLVVRNSTITQNTATSPMGVGGIAMTGLMTNVGTLTIGSTILAGNTGALANDLGFFTGTGNKVGGNNNIVGAANTLGFVLTGVGNQSGIQTAPLDPLLGPLANNGGPTLTHLPLPGSPAIGMGNNEACLAIDQRQGPRTVNNPDVGSAELKLAQVSGVPINAGAVQRSTVTQVRIDFGERVSFMGSPALAILLNRQSDNAAPAFNATVDNAGPTTIVTLSFFGTIAVNGLSLADGRYTLKVLAGQVFNANGQLDGNGDGVPGDDFVLLGTPANGLFRFYGDGDGDGDVDPADFLAFRLSFLNNSSTFNFNGSGQVTSADLLQFRVRFLGMV